MLNLTYSITPQTHAPIVRFAISESFPPVSTPENDASYMIVNGVLVPTGVTRC